MSQPVTTSAQKTTTFHYVVLVLLIVLASIERIYGIDRQGLWGDELFAVLISYKYNFHNVWDMLINDSHPPGYVAMMYWILPWVGYSDFAVRLHALIYGILWIPLIFWLGKRWASANVGLLAAALVASSYSAIYFSQEARAYSMLVAFNLANLICFLEILFAKNTDRGYIKGFIISATIMLYLHYTCFVFISAEILLYLILHFTQTRKGSLREMLIIFGIPLLLYAPWIGFMINHLTDQSRNWAVSAVPAGKDVFYVLQNLWGPDYQQTQLYIAALASIGIIAGIDHYKNGFTPRTGIVYTLLFLLVVPVFAFYIESIIWTPIFEKRYFLVTLPVTAVLVALLIKGVADYFVKPSWQTTTFILVIVISTVWHISTNIERKLYSVLDKDPFREAVNIVSADLKANKITDGYTVIMTHNEFEHYLRRAHISYDNRWEFHRFYVPQHIGKVTEYLNARPTLNTFYYLSVDLQTTQAAAFALKQNYKLLSSARLTSTSGAINIFKFSTKEHADAGQLNDSDSNRTNDMAKLIAQETAHQNPETYTSLITHDWMYAYLKLNKIQIDEKWPGRQFQVDLQFANVSDYLYAHPSINTLYYFALREPQTQTAAMALQLKYQLVSIRTFDVAAGKLDVYKFNVKVKPALSAELKQEIQNNPINLAAAVVGQYTQHENADRYITLVSHGWFEPYLNANGVQVDESWLARRYEADFAVEGVFAYINQHKAATTLYYLVLRENKPETGLLPLLLKYPLLSRDTVDSPQGKLDIYRFNLQGKKSADISAYSDLFSLSPVNRAATWVAKQVGTSKADSYLILTSRQWYNLYLRKQGLDVDREWPGHLYSVDRQGNDVLKYLTDHPSIKDLYYVALRNEDAERATKFLQNRYRIISKNTVETTLGNIDALHFEIK